MDIDPSTISFATLLTLEGIVIAGAIVTAFVALLRNVFPAITVSGAAMAFGVSAVLYALAAAATGASSFDPLLRVFVAWLSCATTSVGIHSAVTHSPLPKLVEGLRG